MHCINKPVGVRLSDDEIDVSAVHGRVLARFVEPEVDSVRQEQGVRADRPVFAGVRDCLEKIGLLTLVFSGCNFLSRVHTERITAPFDCEH